MAETLYPNDDGRNPESQAAREQRGLAIAAVCKLTKKGGVWLVPSQNSNAKYTVSPDPSAPHCTCADHETRGCKCKHIFAVEFVIQRELFPDGTIAETRSVTVSETTIRKPTYKQNWPAYNAAQVNEKARLQILLRELCAGIDEPPQVGRGRPRTDRAISRNDVLPFANMLRRIGKVPRLDLVLVSPGGDGTAAETMLHLCRRYCTDRIRVAVPSFAKSAATLIALGADEIIMGESSELGPIDAQISIVQDNAEQQVSADHFLRAKNEAVLGLKSQKAEIITASQIQLSLLSPAFLQHCEDSMQFGREFARRQLCAHMFKNECAADGQLWGGRIDKIVQNLTASSKHLSHGKMINVDDIASDPDLVHLKIKSMDPTDDYWVALNELLMRTETISQMHDIGKVLFSKDFQMFGN